MKRITVAALATALMVGGASVAFSQSGAGSDTRALKALAPLTAMTPLIGGGWVCSDWVVWLA